MILVPKCSKRLNVTLAVVQDSTRLIIPATETISIAFVSFDEVILKKMNKILKVLKY